MSTRRPRFRPFQSCSLKVVIAAFASLIAVAAAPSKAHATDYYLEGSVLGGGSTWSSHDGNVQGGLRTGFAFVRNIIGLEVQGRFGYAGIDQRMIEGLGFGTKLSIPIKPVTPHLRLGMIHLHEEPVVAWKKDVAGALVGVGDGIRHRFGFESALGLDWTFAHTKKVGFIASAEGYIDAFGDDKGPKLYSGAGLGMGIQYHL
jgi:hypothetical protein